MLLNFFSLKNSLLAKPYLIAVMKKSIQTIRYANM